MLTFACLQDLSQARRRWPVAADGFLSLFGAKVVLGGIGDLATLELVSRLGGEVDVPARSTSRSSRWAVPTTSWSPRRQRAIPVEAVNRLPPGRALALVGTDGPSLVGTPPWWSCWPFRAAVERPSPTPHLRATRRLPSPDDRHGLGR